MIAIRQGMVDDAAFMLFLDGLVPGRPRNRDWYESALLAGEGLVATFEGTTAGFAIHHRHFFQRNFLSLLIVEPLCRRHGVASALVAAVEDLCGGQDLFTSTNESNTTMQAALLRWGFRPSGRIDNIDPGDAELVYIKQPDARKVED